MCKDCPFNVINTLKFKPDIYEEVKEVNRGYFHKCHTSGKVKTCAGFIKKAKDENQFNKDVFYNEEF